MSAKLSCLNKTKQGREMRLCEITDANRTILILSSISTDFTKDFELIVKAKNLFVELKRTRNLQQLLDSNIASLETKIHKFFSTALPNPRDPDITQLKKDASIIREQLISIKEEIQNFIK